MEWPQKRRCGSNRQRTLGSAARRTNPAAEVPASPVALIVIFAAPQTAPVQAPIFGVFNMPFVPYVQLARQCLPHGILSDPHRQLLEQYHYGLRAVAYWNPVPTGNPELSFLSRLMRQGVLSCRYPHDRKTTYRVSSAG